MLTVLADLTDLRADHAASIAALEEAVAIGRELNAWGDLAYVEARLAIVRARTGELARARAELDQVGARRPDAARTDRHRPLGDVHADRAGLARGRSGRVVDYCLEVLTAFDSYQAIWWEPLRARIRARLAMAVLAQGDEGRCRELLGAALDAAARWTEHPPLAAVLDACACYALHPADRARRTARTADNATAARPVITTDRAELAARLLGAAHAVRGAFDESSLDAPQARAAARAALGPAAFDAAYRSAADSTYQTALDLARAALSST